MKNTTRYSKQRESILNLLSSTKSHPTAEWLYENLKKENESAGIATVYRNLRQLVSSGEIQSFETGNHIEHYDACTAQHYHFVCERCFRVFDIDMEPIKNLNKKAEERSGYKVREHSLIFYGECNDCKETHNNSKKERD